MRIAFYFLPFFWPQRRTNFNWNQAKGIWCINQGVREDNRSFGTFFRNTTCKCQSTEVLRITHESNIWTKNSNLSGLLMVVELFELLITSKGSCPSLVINTVTLSVYSSGLSPSNSLLCIWRAIGLVFLHSAQILGLMIAAVFLLRCPLYSHAVKPAVIFANADDIRGIMLLRNDH